MQIRHAYLKNTTIVTHLGNLVLDEKGIAEVPEGTEIVHPDLTIIQVKTDNPEKKEEKPAKDAKPVTNKNGGNNKPVTKNQSKNQTKPEAETKPQTGEAEAEPEEKAEGVAEEKN
ncbi:MAG TPA: hypothetical protein VHO03_16920 [Ignavibacteriales bacterium]|nr:hypothetical protein [Ignavibacteriales bacterium]